VADGAAASALVSANTASCSTVTVCRQQAGDLLGCAWPAPPEAAARPAEPVTWLAGIAVITARCRGRPEWLRTMGYEKFLAAVRRELPRREEGRAFGHQAQPGAAGQACAPDRPR
jgi:hypothetical protein